MLSRLKRTVFVVPLVSAFLVAGYSPAAHAYGPEGIFGGRPMPDSSVDFSYIPAPAEDRPERAESVLSRPRPDYDPIPYMVGDFGLYPSIESGVAYDNNIYASRQNHNYDYVGTVRPVISGQSDWNRNSLTFTAYGDINQFSNYTHESYQNALANVQGRYDVARGSWFGGYGGVEHLVEPRSSPNNVNGKDPVTFDLFKAGATGYRGLGLFHGEADYDFKRLSYDNVSTSTGAVIDQSSRNRNQNSVQGKVTYDVNANIVPFVRVGYNRRDYDSNTLRQSQGYNTDIGSTFDFGGITTVEAYVGWLSQDYYNYSTNKVNSAPDFGGRIDWNVTGTTSLAIEGNRTIEESNDPLYSNYMQTGTSATLTHELLRNVIVEADANYSYDKFKGITSRNDDVFGLGSGFRWMINRHLYSDVNYNWSRRVSSDPTIGYFDNVITFRVGASM